MRTKKLVFFGVVVGIVMVLSGFFMVYRQALMRLDQSNATQSLGITYVPLTAKQAAGLGVANGALVTEVVPDSWADRVGIKVDDVIVTFNGVNVGQGVSLYGVMLACPQGSTVEMNIWRSQTERTVTVLHTQ